jgi:hypothetical protein
MNISEKTTCSFVLIQDRSIETTEFLKSKKFEELESCIEDIEQAEPLKTIVNFIDNTFWITDTKAFKNSKEIIKHKFNQEVKEIKLLNLKKLI